MLSLFCANFILFSPVVVVIVVLEMYDNEFLNKGEKTMIQLNHNIVMYMAFAVFSGTWMGHCKCQRLRASQSR